MWFGITTNSSFDAAAKWSGIARQIFSMIKAYRNFLNSKARSCVQIVMKYAP